MRKDGDQLTLNTDVYIILRLLSLSCIFVGFGEGVCGKRMLAAELEAELR